MENSLFENRAAAMSIPEFSRPHGHAFKPPPAVANSASLTKILNSANSTPTV
jgi:hypothetical protein